MVIFVAVLVLLADCVGSQSFEDEIKLRKYLLTDYNNWILPMKNQTETVHVAILFKLRTIHDLKEKSQVFRTTGTILMEWTNEILTWELSNYGGIGSVLLKPSQIWLPDLVIENSIQAARFDFSNNAYVSLKHTGECIWYPDFLLETWCTVNITKFPFDTQHCRIDFTTWVNHESRLRLTRMEDKDNTTNENGEWAIKETNAEYYRSLYQGAYYGKVTYKYTLKRRVTYHIINTILPILLLSIINVLAFVLPPESGEKMSLSITIVLAYAVFLTVINENMPTISTSISILAVYVVVVLGTGTLCTFISAVSLNYYHGEERRKRNFFAWLSRRTTAIKRDPASPNPVTESDGHDNTQNSKVVNGDLDCPAEERPPVQTNQMRRDFVDRIDIYSFWVVLSMSILFAWVSLIMLITN